MVSRFDVQPVENDEKGYGIMIALRDDFSVVSDERLNGKYNKKTFSDIDELGLPKFDRNGNRTWYARNEGLSRLCLNRNLDLFSGGVNLAYSDEYGQVVVVSGEAAGFEIASKRKA